MLQLPSLRERSLIMLEGGAKREGGKIFERKEMGGGEQNLVQIFRGGKISAQVPPGDRNVSHTLNRKSLT